MSGNPWDSVIAAWKERAARAENELLQLNAARIGYASEFPKNAEGLPDVRNIHANIRALKAERDALREKVFSLELRLEENEYNQGE